jgi:hydrogenase expression/formation protein HypD
MIMRFVDEYHDVQAVSRVADGIKRITTRPWTIMEICGGQTHSIVKHGIDRLLPEGITLLHGPGCPVCVTSATTIDQAIRLAADCGVILCSFGDMMRVPGNGTDLLATKAAGGDVRMVYSPLDAVRLARENPDREVVFFAIGFETTAPANAAAVYQAHRMALKNFSILSAQVRVPPAVETILAAPDCATDGFLAAGHVCTVMGFTEYESITERFGTPIVVTGFEPLDILQGIYMAVNQLEHGRSRVENQYSRAVTRQGNRQAQEMMYRIFEVVDRDWRGIGIIPGSGLGLKAEYRHFDAEAKFAVGDIAENVSTDCISGEILQGLKKPADCPAFRALCTPERPLGATMVSSEGACAAYYRYRKSGIA